jgi:hypothetical protein
MLAIRNASSPTYVADAAKTRSLLNARAKLMRDGMPLIPRNARR